MIETKQTVNFFQEALQSPAIQRFEAMLGEGNSLILEELWDSPKALIAALAAESTKKNILILTGKGIEESRLFHDFASFSERPVIDFPAWETLPGENVPPSPDIVGERYDVIEQIRCAKEPLIIVCSLQACLQKMIGESDYATRFLKLSVKEDFYFELLIDHLVESGYKRSPTAADKGEFAVRGGIIDLFPVSSPDPFRIEFFGDTIESIRTYDPIGQKSVKSVKSISIPPAREMELLNQADRLATILDYLGKETIVTFDDLEALEDRYAHLKNLFSTTTKTFCSIEEFLDTVQSYQTLYFSQKPIQDLSQVRYLEKPSANYYSEQAPPVSIEFELFGRFLQAKKSHHPFLTVREVIGEDLEAHELIPGLQRLPEDTQLHMLSQTKREEQNLRAQLSGLTIPTKQSPQFHMAYLSLGMAIRDTKLLLFPMTELSQRFKIRRQKLRSTYHTTPAESYELDPGDTVVHLHNGIGKYKGLTKKTNHDGVEGEYFLIQYANDAQLYVPLQQAHLISKYVGARDENPKLHQIGSTKWKKAKEATERSIMGYASELLQLYAERSQEIGRPCREDSEDVTLFEDEFPFVETEDQQHALEAIKQDLQSKKPMDRLVCGDVGYGKTEVAMRAAFKAVLDGGKQVALLAPTTVLALQHFETFQERMRNFPVKVALLSRFRSTKGAKQTLDSIASGAVDIIIGTHRMVSKDVIFKDLGLVIIDEEQRFGVRTKEHLKKLTKDVNTLSMSATPIPRTLYMSFIGVRDMSVINTPPQDRLPIKTIVAEPHPEIIKNAIIRELTRDGQVFYIHNRVETIYDAAAEIRKLVPEARVGVAHGQMAADEVDAAFHGFKQGTTDILVATSIVENGIDIPNANTILIDRADRFGIADLYQMRGRVGRWNRRAYAYLLIPKNKRLNETSQKRINALAGASGYGAGMKVAMHDLEIRGAGDILGTEQSGHVSQIGFHLYCRLLKRTLDSMQGRVPSVLVDTKIDFPVDARLPESYVNEVSLRMEIYQRLGEAVELKDVDAIWEELKDRFGAPPIEGEWLYHVSRVRVLASRAGFTSLKLEKYVLHAVKKKGKESEKLKCIIGKHSDPKTFAENIIQALEL